MKKTLQKSILIAGSSGNDFSTILRDTKNTEIHMKQMNELVHISPDDYDAFAILGDPSTDIMSGTNLNAVKSIINSDKPVFIRVLPGICGVVGYSPESTRFKRLVYTGSSEISPELDSNDLLDDQDNIHISSTPPASGLPILVYKNKVMSHKKYKGANSHFPAEYAMWMDQHNTIYCTFDILNFNRSRFAPLKKWQAIIESILNHLTGSLNESKFTAAYGNGFINGDNSLTLQDSFYKAVDWFKTSDTLIDNGKKGVYEGYATEINPSGTQKKAVEIRNDCCGETMFSYFIDSLLNNSDESREISDNLSDFIFSEMFTEDPAGILHGMMKWSLSSANICYQDDVARAVIPQMLKCRYSGSDKYMDKCTEALEFLYKTTGTDGLRVTRTENQRLDASEILRLSSEPADYPSAHYTAYYLGALLLNYTLTGNRKFRDMGVKGLETIMSAYPETKRCQSETQELCRLILPLSLMYEATGLKRHRDMLYRVARDLQKYRHKSGAYLEWDSGYKSRYSHTTGDECSILTENGDPVADLLYTINWLPFAFIQAYFITKDSMFFNLWQDISNFMKNAQIESNYSVINGAWARGWDVELNEVFALPNDIGWGPWCIESGWTVAEIASGIGMGLIKDRLSQFY